MTLGDLDEEQIPSCASTPNYKKPAKADLTDAEFRRWLKGISEWRKKRLAKLRTKDSR